MTKIKLIESRQLWRGTSTLRFKLPLALFKNGGISPLLQTAQRMKHIYHVYVSYTEIILLDFY